MTNWRRGAREHHAHLRWGEMMESLDLEAALDALDVEQLREERGELWCHCPLPDHPGADASGTNFSVNLDSFQWKCFTCDRGGGLPDLVMALRGFEGDEDDSAFQQALRWLAPFADVSFEMEEPSDAEKAVMRALRPRKRKAYRFAAEMPPYSTRLLDRLEPVPAEILGRWHILPEAAADYGLGYDPERGRGSYVGPALVIPHFFEGELVGYQERWLDDDRPKSIPKYTNTEDFPKRETLFGWDRAVAASARGQRVIIGESAMTVVRLHSLGLPSAATFGGSVSTAQLALLARLRSGITLAYESDPTGEGATGKLMDALAPLMGPRLWVAEIDEGKADLADLDDRRALDVLDRAVEYAPIGA